MRDVNGFARRYVPDQLETENVERNAFRSNHVIGAGFNLAFAEHQRPNAEFVAEADNSAADHHRDRRIGTTASLMHAGDRLEDVVWLRPVPAHALHSCANTFSSTSESVPVFT